MIYCGIGDEAGNALSSQIAATHALGWSHVVARNVTVPGFGKGNLHDLPDAAFELAVGELEAAQVGVYCFATTIGNWAKRIEDPFDITLAELNRAIPRMQRLRTKYLRIMSYRVRDDVDQWEAERFRRLREITARCLDAGLQPVHENCMNYGGMSPSHALRLLSAVPGLKWVFDTGNPVLNPDGSQPEPRPQQDPWKFWTAVRDQTVHLHIKDARWVPAKRGADYHWPGEGDGAVRRILADALTRGYTGALSIEPHMVAVFHDTAASAAVAQDEALQTNYIEYGRRLMALVAEVEAERV